MGKYDGKLTMLHIQFFFLSRLVSFRLASTRPDKRVSHFSAERAERQLKTVNLCALYLVVTTVCVSRRCHGRCHSVPPFCLIRVNERMEAIGFSERKIIFSMQTVMSRIQNCVVRCVFCQRSLSGWVPFSVSS